MATIPFLEQYDSLDIIGNGSFGIIRKVRRKSDGLIFARKELNFERMSERDRKQIVSEVNILKELHHDHVVRYHDRYVDRDAGILYILMEFCGGGDLSMIIKQAQKQNRPIPEDVIWNYLMQILLALHHCHHPNGHGRSGSGSATSAADFAADGKERRAQILHRDLKPDNVFLDENNTVKLGDFGLSKVLAQASFANTYVGTPYYMSPELMQEKAYDSKSDIWSLGCLVYELCALKPPFHEAKTHSELSIFIRNGRIPPLPKGYSQGLSGIIKAMLNLNPAMRPSAAQLLQHERLELSFKVTEAEKMLLTVKSHKTNLMTKERDIAAREKSLLENECRLASLMAEKDQEISSLRTFITQLQENTARDIDTAIKKAVSKREEELRILVMKREEEVAAAMAKREEEIMEAVRRREAEISEAWVAREAEIQKEVQSSIIAVEERVEWLIKKETELQEEEARLLLAKEEFADKLAKWEDSKIQDQKEKLPLEDVQNLPEATQETPVQTHRRLRSCGTLTTSSKSNVTSGLETPITRQDYQNYIPSAMKGVVLTSTGETVATPSPAELAKLFDSSPKVGLNFTKLFEFGDGVGDEIPVNTLGEPYEDDTPLSPSHRKEREREKKEREKEKERGEASDSRSTTSVTQQVPSSAAPTTRLRKPSIRASSSRPPVSRSSSLPSSTSDPVALSITSTKSNQMNKVQPKPLPHPHLHSQILGTATASRAVPGSHPLPEYDFADEENLPSPFLKRSDHLTAKTSNITGSIKAKKKPSSCNSLRVVAAVNNAGRRKEGDIASGSVDVLTKTPSNRDLSDRPSLASARRAGEEARKALSRS